MEDNNKPNQPDQPDQPNPYFLIQLHGANPNSSTSQAKVSLNKMDLVTQHKWYLGKDGYPFTYIKGGRVPLHRYIWWERTGIWTNEYVKPDGTVGKHYVDHVNRDKLDATDENLRLSTPAENSYNKTSTNQLIDPITGNQLHHIKLTKKSGYSVSLSKDGKTHRVNRIASLEEAKEIYNLMALELFGEFAVLYDLD